MAILEDTANAKPAGHAHDQAEIRSLVAALATLTTNVAAKAPAGSAAGYRATAARTAGSYTPAVTTWANLDTALDLTLTAVAGQWIEVGISGSWSSEATSGDLNAVTLVSGSPVNAIGTGAAETSSSEGIQAWRGNNASVSSVGGSVLYQLQAGDISGGQVVIRFRVRTTSAATKTLFATADRPFLVWARNLG